MSGKHWRMMLCQRRKCQNASLSVMNRSEAFRNLPYSKSANTGSHSSRYCSQILARLSQVKWLPYSDLLAPVRPRYWTCWVSAQNWHRLAARWLATSSLTVRSLKDSSIQRLAHTSNRMIAWWMCSHHERSSNSRAASVSAYLRKRLRNE